MPVGTKLEPPRQVSTPAELGGAVCRRVRVGSGREQGAVTRRLEAVTRLSDPRSRERSGGYDLQFEGIGRPPPQSSWLVDKSTGDIT
jgi:hypothetical protein